MSKSENASDGSYAQSNDFNIDKAELENIISNLEDVDDYNNTCSRESGNIRT